MLSTQTGSFPIGFRRGWSEWQKDLPALLDWALDADLGVIDLGRDGDAIAAQVVDRGLKIGSVDLKDWGFISDDPEVRARSLEANARYIEACAANGVERYFAVMLPQDPRRARRENHELMIPALQELGKVLEANHGFLVIEGWPGEGALCCTPESYRATLAETSDAIGINYDPSHLIRMGIDPIRFLEEFVDRVYHVHGKDTEIMPEEVYEFGTEQPATFAKGHGFGSTFWRYTIPGHGQMRWTRGFQILEEHGYGGSVCIELEDERFNGSEDGEKAGLRAGAAFLASA